MGIELVAVAVSLLSPAAFPWKGISRNFSLERKLFIELSGTGRGCPSNSEVTTSGDVQGMTEHGTQWPGR